MVNVKTIIIKRRDMEFTTKIQLFDIIMQYETLKP